MHKGKVPERTQTTGPKHLRLAKQTCQRFASVIQIHTTEDAVMKAQKIKEVCLRLAKTQVSIEEVKSFYWWDGKVNFDPEWRVSIDSFETAREAIAKIHSYDLPMIIYDVHFDESATHWKGIQEVQAEEAIRLAEELVSKRLVACAQASQHSLTVKTVHSCKTMVEELLPKVHWSPINGNDGYLKWLEEQCTAGTACTLSES
eukprot:symbB.v1.2.021260.t1/scaffold1824.1/size125051/11